MVGQPTGQTIRGLRFDQRLPGAVGIDVPGPRGYGLASTA
jgi:hypothetical protein